MSHISVSLADARRFMRNLKRKEKISKILSLVHCSYTCPSCNSTVIFLNRKNSMKSGIHLRKKKCIRCARYDRYRKTRSSKIDKILTNLVD